MKHLGDVILVLVSVAVAVALVALGGCSLRGQSLPTKTAVSVAYDPALEAQCRKLDRTVMGFTATSIGLGVAGGANGLASIFTTSTDRTATAATGVGVAILSAVFTYLSNAEAQVYTRMCTAGITGAP